LNAPKPNSVLRKTAGFAAACIGIEKFLDLGDIAVRAVGQNQGSVGQAVTVALTNKLARIALAIMTTGELFRLEAPIAPS
jgi:hypothetical protein